MGVPTFALWTCSQQHVLSPAVATHLTYPGGHRGARLSLSPWKYSPASRRWPHPPAIAPWGDKWENQTWVTNAYWYRLLRNHHFFALSNTWYPNIPFSVFDSVQLAGGKKAFLWFRCNSSTSLKDRRSECERPLAGKPKRLRLLSQIQEKK